MLVHSEVPQGSQCSPHLFLPFVNDMFAHDVKLFKPAGPVSDCHAFQFDVHKLNQ